MGTVFTRHGAAIAQNFYSADTFEQIAMELISEAASLTNSTAGDGSTVTAVLTCSIFLEAAKLQAAGHQTQALVKGINTAIECARKTILASAFTMENDQHSLGIAKSASGGAYREAAAIVDAANLVGPEGFVDLQLAENVSPNVRVADGFPIEGNVVATSGVTIADGFGEKLKDPSLVFVSQSIVVHRSRYVSVPTDQGQTQRTGYLRQ